MELTPTFNVSESIDDLLLDTGLYEEHENEAHFTNGLATKVTGMLLEMDQTEVFHLIESQDALKKKAEDVVRLVSSRCDAADQLGSLSLKD
ncbi:hypothetical protein IFM89_014595 [Coptis chinensis]|uniref:PABC domain-containing protein n=1 Tax=Coptis chinensis TaxID=261450 RepID=A0A835LRL1_9MAGN|nr:hypothetical protein IFM89_014595 [Coptis chinensis]